MERRRLLTNIGLIAAISSLPMASLAKEMETNPRSGRLSGAFALGNKMGSDPKARRHYETLMMSITRAIKANSLTNEEAQRLVGEVPGLADVADTGSGGQGEPAGFIIFLLAWAIGFAAGWLARGW